MSKDLPSVDKVRGRVWVRHCNACGRLDFRTWTHDWKSAATSVWSCRECGGQASTFIEIDWHKEFEV